MKCLSSELICIFFLCSSLVSVVENKFENSTVTILKRGKRYLDFPNSPKSRMFFRANIKSNIIQINQLWAHAYGFRANYFIENDKEHRIFRRHVYETIQELMEHHGFDGRSCVLKSFCESNISHHSDGMLYKMFKLIFKLPDEDKHLFTDFHTGKCDGFYENCPLSFKNLSPFTDDV